MHPHVHRIRKIPQEKRRSTLFLQGYSLEDVMHRGGEEVGITCVLICILTGRMRAVEGPFIMPPMSHPEALMHGAPWDQCLL